MYHIAVQHNHWRIYKGKDIILCGIGSVESAFAIAKANDIVLTFRNCELKKVA